MLLFENTYIVMSKINYICKLFKVVFMKKTILSRFPTLLRFAKMLAGYHVTLKPVTFKSGEFSARAHCVHSVCVSSGRETGNLLLIMRLFAVFSAF